MTAGGGLALAILAFTVWLVITRPRGLPEAVGAGGGAVLALAFGLALPGDVWAGVRDTAGILMFLVAIMVLTAVAEAAGVFRWLAGLTLVTARGRGWLLFVNVYVFGAVLTLLLSLDVTAVVLTPLVCALVLPLRLDARPFVYACVMVANTASLALPVSNLTNMLVYELLGVGFWEFVRYLAVPNVVALITTLVVLLWRFRRELPGRIRVTMMGEAEGYRAPVAPFFRASAVALAATTILLLVSGIADWPFWPAAIGGAVPLAGLALGKRWIEPAAVRRSVAWGLPPFVVGMYVVVAGVYRALASVLEAAPGALIALPGPLPVLVTAAVTALGANAVNNLPLSLGAIQVLRQVPEGIPLLGGGDLRQTLSFGTLLGVNLGPNLTVTGSLATMLCLATAHRQGMQISPMEFLRVGALVTLPTLLAGSLTAWLFLCGG